MDNATRSRLDHSRPLPPGTHIRYMYGGRVFIGTVLQAGLFCIHVRVENRIQEHFIEYRNVLAVWDSSR